MSEKLNDIFKKLEFAATPPNGKNRRWTITARVGDVSVRDVFDADSYDARDKFAKRVAAVLELQSEDATTFVSACNAAITRVTDEALKAAAEKQACEEPTNDAATAIAPPWPEPWPEPVPLAAVLNETEEAIHKHVVISREAGIAATLWIAWTYAVDRGAQGPPGDIAPLLAIVSPVRRCGKTQMMSVLSYLCPRVIPASNITAAALFRLVEMERPTLLVDECDVFLKDNEDLRCLLNAAHRRDGAYVVRCGDKNSDYPPRKYSVFGPKALAMIGTPAPTIEDRSIVIRLQRKRRDEVIERLNAAAAERLKMIARRLMAAVTPEIRAAMYAANPEIPATLNDRQADNWRNLIALADIAGDHWPTTARGAAVIMAVSANQDAETIGILAIADCKDAFGFADRLTPTDIVSRLIRTPDRPWAKFSRGGPITPKKLANLLAPYGIVARRVHAGRFYSREDFEAAFLRYVDVTPEKPVITSHMDVSTCGITTYDTTD